MEPSLTPDNVAQLLSSPEEEPRGEEPSIITEEKDPHEVEGSNDEALQEQSDSSSLKEISKDEEKHAEKPTMKESDTFTDQKDIESHTDTDEPVVLGPSESPVENVETKEEITEEPSERTENDETESEVENENPDEKAASLEDLLDDVDSLFD